MNNTIHVVDASVFIEAKNRYYAFDLAPRFWRSLLDHAQGGRVVSIDHVRDELVRMKDELTSWSSQEFSEHFARTDDIDVVNSYRELMAWVQSQSRFTDAAKAEFADTADGWLVAYAKAHGCVVVTEEKRNSAKKSKVPIPDLCDAFKVPCCDTFAMLRALGVRFE